MNYLRVYSIHDHLNSWGKLNISSQVNPDSSVWQKLMHLQYHLFSTLLIWLKNVHVWMLCPSSFAITISNSWNILVAGKQIRLNNPLDNKWTQHFGWFLETNMLRIMNAKSSGRFQLVQSLFSWLFWIILCPFWMFRVSSATHLQQPILLHNCGKCYLEGYESTPLCHIVLYFQYPSHTHE